MKVMRFKVQAYRDREAVVISLANSGYKVWIEEKEEEFRTIFIVCVEV